MSRRFSQRPLGQRIALVLLACVEVALLVAAQVDVQRRPPDQVAGRKLWWRATCLVNFVGPLSYFRCRRRLT